LRAPPDATQQYEQLKRQLATRHGEDREAHSDGKTAIVVAITSDASR